MSDVMPLEIQMLQNVPVFVPPSYFDDKVGAQVKQAAAELFQKGHSRFIVDLRQCKIINSRGLASMLDLAMKCTDDYRGKLVVTGIDQTKQNLFELIGLDTIITPAPTLEEAARLALEG